MDVSLCVWIHRRHSNPDVIPIHAWFGLSYWDHLKLQKLDFFFLKNLFIIFRSSYVGQLFCFPDFCVFTFLLIKIWHKKAITRISMFVLLVTHLSLWPFQFRVTWPDGGKRWPGSSWAMSALHPVFTWQFVAFTWHQSFVWGNDLNLENTHKCTGH